MSQHLGNRSKNLGTSVTDVAEVTVGPDTAVQTEGRNVKYSSDAAALLEGGEPASERYDWIFETPGTYTWQVPDGISKISLVLIGGGGAGNGGAAIYGGGGGGGNLRYINEFQVQGGTNNPDYVIRCPNTGDNSSEYCYVWSERFDALFGQNRFRIHVVWNGVEVYNSGQSNGNGPTYNEGDLVASVGGVNYYAGQQVGGGSTVGFSDEDEPDIYWKVKAVGPGVYLPGERFTITTGVGGGRQGSPDGEASSIRKDGVAGMSASGGSRGLSENGSTPVVVDSYVFPTLRPIILSGGGVSFGGSGGCYNLGGGGGGAGGYSSNGGEGSGNPPPSNSGNLNENNRGESASFYWNGLSSDNPGFIFNGGGGAGGGRHRTGQGNHGGGGGTGIWGLEGIDPSTFQPAQGGIGNNTDGQFSYAYADGGDFTFDPEWFNRNWARQFAGQQGVFGNVRAPDWDLNEPNLGSYGGGGAGSGSFRPAGRGQNGIVRIVAYPDSANTEVSFPHKNVKFQAHKLPGRTLLY